MIVGLAGNHLCVTSVSDTVGLWTLRPVLRAASPSQLAVLYAIR